MKRIHVATALALGFALIAGGCQRPIPPAFSPDGRTLAYVKGHQLVLLKSGREGVVSTQQPNNIAWSPDGAYLAWSSGGGTSTVHGNSVREPDVVSILDIAHQREVTAVGVGGAIGWLDGDLVAVDEREKPVQLATMDPGSGQIRSEAAVNKTPSDLAPSTSRRELYFTSEGNWFAFDGLNVTQMNDAGHDAPVALGASESLFQESPERLPQRELKLKRWTGSRMEGVVLFGLPPRAGKHGGISIMPINTAVSADLSVVATSVMTMRGREADEQRLLELMRRYKLSSFDKLPKRVNDEMSRLGKRMKFDEVVFIWRTDGERHLVAEWDDTKETHQLAVDPGGRHLAVCSKDGVKMIALQ